MCPRHSTICWGSMSIAMLRTVEKKSKLMIMKLWGHGWAALPGWDAPLKRALEVAFNQTINEKALNWPSLFFFPSNRFSVDNPCIVWENSIISHSNNYWRCWNNLQLLSREKERNKDLENVDWEKLFNYCQLRFRNVMQAYSSQYCSMRNVISREIISRSIFREHALRLIWFFTQTQSTQPEPFQVSLDGL